MFEANIPRILEQLGPDAVVLDVGAWGQPFRRADWVLDRMPYDTRGLYGFTGDGPERFSADTWVRRDICDREPWPFADDQFDFAICSHTLEDVRDPVWVCSELARVARAGYLETPSRLEEQSYGIQGPWVGWGHHVWMMELVEGGVEFVFKHHVMHGRATDHFPAGFHDALSPQERITASFWEGTFSAEERVMDGPDELDAYLADFVASELAARGFDAATRRRPGDRGTRRRWPRGRPRPRS
jgi:hypothetical protein